MLLSGRGGRFLFSGGEFAPAEQGRDEEYVYGIGVSGNEDDARPV